MKIASNKFHFIGVGGIGMSGLAEILAGLGAEVSGSDLSDGPRTQRLASLGVRIFTGVHKAENVGVPDVVVYSSAVSTDNPEYIYALKNKIPLIRRAEALAEIMRLRRGIAIAGTHGKTTTTSMLTSMMMEAGLDPTAIVGGVVKKINSNAKWGRGTWLVAEADESDGSFDKLSPEIAVITNIDNDHLDFYKSFSNLRLAYKNFAEKIPFYGRLIYCGDDSDLKEIFEDFPKKAITYGFFDDMDYSLKLKGDGVFEIFNHKKLIGEFKPALPGNHNALNSLATLIVGLECLDLDFETAVKGIENFEGVGRRFQIHPENKTQITYVDDYAHHPTEVSYAIKAAKEKYVGRRIVAVFQPHRYSRVQLCWDQFLNCFDLSDELFLTDIYPAGESPIEGVNSASLAEDVYHANARHVSGDLDAVKAQIQGLLKENDVVLIMGAGHINQLTPKFYS